MKSITCPVGILYSDDSHICQGDDLDISALAEGVRALSKSFNRETQLLLGGPPFTSEIEREIQNFRVYRESNDTLPQRKRVSLGIWALDQKKNVIGYQAMTLLREAKPTSYERENIGLEGLLNNAHFKLTMTHPDYWGTSVSSDLLRMRLGIARKVSGLAVVDIKFENERSLGFFVKHGFENDFKWKTPKGVYMQRMKRDLCDDIS